MKLPFISRVVIKNYKSIAGCNVKLGPLQFLVGRNGSGKSNFLDALAFVRDALAENLEQAFYNRQGPNEVRRRSNGHPQNFGIRLDFNLPSGESGMFAFEISAAQGKNFYVKREMARIERDGAKIASYETQNGELQIKDKKQFPPVARDRLYLPSIAIPEYERLCSALKTMGIYKLNPKEISDFQKPDTKTLLKSDGSNIAHCLTTLDEGVKQRILHFLKNIVPFVSGFEPRILEGGLRQAVRFSQGVKGRKEPWWFPAINMSDGTLRVLGILVALLHKQKGGGGDFPLLVGIEEPETALHPRAVSTLLDALEEASEERQVIATTHSAEMLDNEQIQEEQILPVESKESETFIAPLSEDAKRKVREHLSTAGELLRDEQLRPDAKLFSARERMPLFTKL